jgi:hypothetical protein
MRDSETPLVFTFLIEQGGPILFALLVILGTMTFSSPMMTGLVAGPLFIWLVIRMINRRNDPKRQQSDEEIDELAAEDE